mmetsp:Transcript_64391/g.210000  ORF Transcript_64391/g.210000 Transcript_64391/m.210000 type:complete len:277 (+) Transcript_64391:662-1492(+)
MLGHAVVGDLGEQRVVGGVEDPQGRSLQPGHVDLHMQGDDQCLRDLGEEGDVLLAHPRLPGLIRVPEEAFDVAGEALRNALRLQVLLNQAFLHRSIEVDSSQLIHCIGQAADERGEDYQRKDDDTQCKGPLPEVGGDDVVGRWGELRHHPVEADGVDIPSVCAVETVLGDPVDAVGVVVQGQGIPSASDIVTHQQQQSDRLRQLYTNNHMLGVLAPHEDLQNLPQLPQPEDAYDPKEADDFGEAEGTLGLAFTAYIREHEQVVDANDAKVRNEPRL